MAVSNQAKTPTFSGSLAFCCSRATHICKHSRTVLSHTALNPHTHAGTQQIIRKAAVMDIWEVNIKKGDKTTIKTNICVFSLCPSHKGSHEYCSTTTSLNLPWIICLGACFGKSMLDCRPVSVSFLFLKMSFFRDTYTDTRVASRQAVVSSIHEKWKHQHVCCFCYCDKL